MSDVAERVADARKMIEALEEVKLALHQLSDDGRLGRIESLGQVIAGFAHPLDPGEYAEAEEGSMALLRGFERHGEGLRPYKPGDPVEEADVLIAGDRSVWIVDRLDEEGAVKSVVGGTASPKGEPLLRWRPSSQGRRWIMPGQEPGPAYKDAERVLDALTALWGLSESETRFFKRPEALFWQLTETPGVSFSRRGLDDESDEPTVREWLIGRGAAIIGDALPVPGDLFWDPARPGFGIVLREEGGSIDYLAVERTRRGPVGEAKGAAQIARATPVPKQAMFWRPG